MPRCILLSAALLLAPPLFAQSVPAQASDTAAVPEMTREQKLTQYRHDQINLLALRPEPEALLAAALLAAADAEDKTRPAALKPPALLKRAQAAGENSALVWWVTAAAECRAAKSCPAPETLQKLEAIDPENAAVWMLSLWRAQQANDAPAARAALASAAQAKRYDDHFGALVSAVYEAQDVLPMSGELLAATGADASVAGYRLLTAANLVVGEVASPGGNALAQACHGGADDAALVADCIAVARKMELSGSLFAQSAGVALHMELLPPGPERDAVAARRRGLAWQMQHMSELAGSLANDVRVTRTYTQALAASGDESAAVFAVLRSKGVALEPPADWQPLGSAPAAKP